VSTQRQVPGQLHFSFWRRGSHLFVVFCVLSSEHRILFSGCLPP
jgi:hypothetical protein